MVVFAMFAFITPSDETHAASSTKSKITLKTYKSKKFLKYPQVSELKSTTAQKNINKVLSNHIQGSYKGYLELKKSMEKIKKEGYCTENPTSCNYEYQTSYKVKYNNNGKLSILIYDYVYEGGAHGYGPVTSYNFDLKTGKQYTINNILTSNTKYKKVTNYAKKYMINHPDIFTPGYLSMNEFKIDKNNQFYFTSNGIYLIFQEYEVAPYSSGYPIIKVSSSIYK